MRGKAHCADNNARKHRITPAHAGKRLIFARFVAISRDHPRPCGEKLTLEGQRLTYIGSPPPMRGKEPGGAGSRRLRGITPAHAGKRAASVVQTYAASGSPPPMRGKGGQSKSAGGPSGITPAHAGKRTAASALGIQSKDHPRPCGEKSSQPLIALPITGSPPPMRGKAYHTFRAPWLKRITPAHAGKRLRKRRNTGIFVFQISRFHSVSHTPDTSYGNRPALYVRRLPRTPAALQASKAYDRARWAAYAWLFAVCPHTGS